MSTAAYDLVVIGSGPAGQKGAIAAAKLGKKVAVIDRKEMVGGVCLHTGTIPSKTLREAILYLSGFRERTFYGRDYTVRSEITVADLAFRVQKVMAQARWRSCARSSAQPRHDAPRLGAFRRPAHARGRVGRRARPRVRGEHILIACGTRPAHNATVPARRRADHRLRPAPQGQDACPRDLIVVGAGVIGLEYASMVAALNIKVTVIEARPTILDFVDREMIEALMYFMRQRGATFRLGEKVVSVGYDEKRRVVAVPRERQGDPRRRAALHASGRQTNADLLNLPAAGLAADERGKIDGQRVLPDRVPHIYAAGDVIGFPALASTSMEQGRLASCHMFGAYCESRPDTIPYGIYTIPEISMVGKTEQELTEAKVPYEIGLSQFEELAKGQMLGVDTGLLKLLFDRKTRKLLGVHIIGERATEIIHIGQAVLAFGGTIDYFRDTVFNYPTMAEAYKVAGLDGLNRSSSGEPRPLHPGPLPSGGRCGSLPHARGANARPGDLRRELQREAGDSSR